MTGLQTRDAATDPCDLGSIRVICGLRESPSAMICAISGSSCDAVMDPCDLGSIGVICGLPGSSSAMICGSSCDAAMDPCDLCPYLCDLWIDVSVAVEGKLT
jgi:hypothetical protein